MYKVIKQWGDGVTGVVGPAVGEVVELPKEEAERRIAEGQIEEYASKRSNPVNKVVRKTK